MRTTLVCGCDRFDQLCQKPIKTASRATLYLPGQWHQLLPWAPPEALKVNKVSLSGEQERYPGMAGPQSLLPGGRYSRWDVLTADALRIVI